MGCRSIVELGLEQGVYIDPMGIGSPPSKWRGFLINIISWSSPPRLLPKFLDLFTS